MPSPQTLHGSYPENGGFVTGLTVGEANGAKVSAVGEATGAKVSAKATDKAIKKAKQMN
jgi:hypothetical protein